MACTRNFNVDLVGGSFVGIDLVGGNFFESNLAVLDVAQTPYFEQNQLTTCIIYVQMTFN